MDNLTDFEKYIANSLLSQLVQCSALTPVYCPEINTEADAESLADNLPIVYIWNEDRGRGTFSVSINGKIIGSILEQKVNRSNRSFATIRDTVIRSLESTVPGSVISSCKQFRTFPSVLFGRHPQHDE